MNSSVVLPLDPVPDPIAILGRLSDAPRPVLFHSAAPGHGLSRYSFASADPVTTIDADADEWPAVANAVRRSIAPYRLTVDELPPFQGGWAGWFAYELGRAFDTMVCAERVGTPVPDVMLGLYDWVVAWDHHAGRAWLISTGIAADGSRSNARAAARLAVARRWIEQPPPVARRTQPRDGPGSSIETDFTEAEYRDAVARVIEHIVAGDIFQANISQRFVIPGQFDPLELYRELHARTPAPMAAYIGHPDFHVLSASPERFLAFDSRTRMVEARPIKGTRRRGDTPALDAAAGAALIASAKDRAENVMIVDLLRNDLSRVAVVGSVDVPSLCELESHPTVHHLVSTVTASLRPGRDALDLLAATFPGGSVTGAPKLRAMEIIAAVEPVRRGVYCGAIGWIGLDGSLDTSIAIRTVTLDGAGASLHAGGGITARSDPGEEYDETLAKARAPLDAILATR